MMGEEAHDVGVSLAVLAQSSDDSATSRVDHVMLGAADDPVALRRLAREVDVVTFDHELVDLEVLATLESEGVILRPSASALAYSVDKARQRESFARAGFPVPAHAVIRRDEDLAVLAGWSQRYGGPPVLKAARGGYDGRGVLFPTDDREALVTARDLLRHGDVVAEERVELRRELAQLVVRGVRGDLVVYPLVTTVQSAGMCSEVHFPAEVDDATREVAREVATRVAEHIDLVGVMAVEFFDTPRELLINELALRPHNSGHWTIEGTHTSQFANHLRAVSGRELGSSDPLAPCAVMVNVVGGDAPGSLDDAQLVEGVAVHDYGKAWRPGRKLGHVTSVGDDAHAVHVRAWTSARAYGTSAREA